MEMHKPTFFSVIVAIFVISCNSHQQDSLKKPTLKEPIAYLTDSDTSGKIMKEEEFWKIIEISSEKANGDYQRQMNTLQQALQNLEPSDIEKFNNTFHVLLAATYDYNLWGASYVINGGCSDDCFDYFREYLIGHGKERFYQTLKDPESCVTWMKSEEEDNWEGLVYSAGKAYEQVTNNPMPITFKVSYKIKGTPFDEATVDKQYPQLSKKFFGVEKKDE